MRCLSEAAVPQKRGGDQEGRALSDRRVCEIITADRKPHYAGLTVLGNLAVQASRGALAANVAANSTRAPPPIRAKGIRHWCLVAFWPHCSAADGRPAADGAITPCTRPVHVK